VRHGVHRDSRRDENPYCALAHGKVLADRFMEPAAVCAAIADHRSAGLDEVDVAVMDLAEKVAEDATSVTAADIDRLRALGLSDDEVFDVVMAATARCFFSKSLDALGAEPDAAYARLEPDLRAALTVGRPIAQS
jgi:alkylhydroperoxidase family enzyme